MRKIVAFTILMAGLLVVSAPTNNSALAQGAKKDKDKDTKVSPKAGAGYIEIGKGRDDKYRFFVRDGGGHLMAMSGAFASEKAAKEGIEALRKVVATAKVSMKKHEKEKE